MQFTDSPELAQLRTEVRDHLSEVMTPERRERIYRSGVSHDAELIAGLVERGWFVPPHLAEAVGAPVRTAVEQSAIDAELMYADAPTYLSATTMMVASVIHHAGTDEMKERILGPALRGEVTIALGFTEPESGSDVAAAATRAVRDGDDWVINGSKMFTTNGHIADHVFLLARTDPTVPKHKGLTMFLVPMDTPGCEAQAVWTLSGERTNITFYSDVRIGDEHRIGEVNAGWSVLNIALVDEHASSWGPHLARLLHHAEAWAHEKRVDDEGVTASPIDDVTTRRRLTRIAMEIEVSDLLQQRCLWMSGNGDMPIAEGPMSKLYSTEALERATEDVVEMAGPDGLRSYLEPTALQDGAFEQTMRFSLGTTIYAGTSEVQRTIIAQRGLKLPRT